MAHGILEMLWLKMILEEFKRPIEMFMARLSLAYNPIQQDMTKHDEIYKQLIKEKVEVGVPCMLLVPKTKNS